VHSCGGDFDFAGCRRCFARESDEHELFNCVRVDSAIGLRRFPALGSDCPRLPRERAAAFLSISTQLGNGPLALALLSSLRPTAVSAKPKLFGEMAIDDCQSQFYCYSADDLRLLDRQTLYRLLLSASLTIESEDCLLRLLL
jgi:hypothetical protein